MKCLICSGDMAYFFSKHFDNEDDLGKADYYRCAACGFSACKNHYEMSDTEWVRLNTTWHHRNNLRTDNPWNRSQRHFNQALMLHLLKKHGIVPTGRWLDYASGQGGLSSQLDHHFAIRMDSFDRYVKPESFPIPESDLVKGGFELVSNTAMFEHVRDRRTLDEIESYVATDGCLALHTLVRGEIPSDPEWMYLLPVHCSFFTNHAMSILMQQWGYTCSIYNEQAKMWVLFKSDLPRISARVDELNRTMGWKFLHFKAGFMDFWP